MQASIADTAAGALGGLACVVVGQPLDTVKVKLQTFPNLYPTLTATIARTFREEGFRGFYAGCAPACISNIGENAVLFLAYGSCQRAIQWLTGSNSSNMTVLERASAGALASIFSSVAITPPDVIKSKLQVQKALLERAGIVSPRRESTWMVIKSIMKEEGPAGFFRGLTSTWVREVPGNVFFFAGYDLSRKLMAPSHCSPADDLGFLRTSIAGGVAGCCFWTAIFPVDVVRTRIQVMGELSGSFWVILGQIFKKEGVRALYKGLAATLIRAYPSNAALFLVYEHSKSLLAQPAGVVHML